MTAWEQFVTAMNNAGPIAAGLAIAAVPVVAGVASYITKLSMQAKIDGLEADSRRIKDEIINIQTSKKSEIDIVTNKFKELESRYNQILQIRASTLSKIDIITSAINDIALRVDAKDYSILVAAPTLVPGDRPDELVFLCASGPQAQKLHAVRVPIDSSMSGQVFQSGLSIIASPTQDSSAFSRHTDEISDYRTDEALCISLNYRGNTIGVAQFLNKRSGPFNNSDIKIASEYCNHISSLVGEFLSDPTRLNDLGYSPRRDAFPASIMFVDLSGFSKLFNNLDNSIINDILNQYFEAIGNIAFAHNAVIDQFIGDGMLIVFDGNVPDHNHIATSIKAAREMLSAFCVLRRRWTLSQYKGAGSLFVRIGLSTGPVTRAEIGHRRLRRITILGSPVNEAALTCKLAPRGHDTFCISNAARQQLHEHANNIHEIQQGVFEFRYFN